MIITTKSQTHLQNNLPVFVVPKQASPHLKWMISLSHASQTA